MNIKIQVPVFCYGSNLHQVNLDEIQEKKFQSILQNDYAYNLQICDIKQLSQLISIEKRVILFIQSEELFGYSEELQEIFNLLHFFKVEKGLCFIVDKEKVKNQEKKTNLISQYINNSSKVFKEIFSHKLDISIFSITKDHSINTYLHYFNTTPLDINSAMFDENLIQILSRDKKQLEIKVLKGILYKNGRFYLQNQTEQNKPIYIEKIEDGLIIVNQFSQQKSFKIEISDDSEYKNQTFMSNKPFTVKNVKDNLIIHASFSSEESLNKFNFDYRKAKELYSLVIGKSEYNIASLEFCCSNNQPFKVVLTLKLQQDDSFPVCSYDDNHSKVNESFVVLYKSSNEIAFFAQNIQDNCAITLTPKVVQENKTVEIDNFYVPIQENELIQKIERGEQKQNGKQILKCRICFEQQAQTILIPCGHIRYCFDCSTDLQECLFCETKIEKRKKISIKLMDPIVNQNLQEIPFKFNEFLIQSLKNNTNIDQALEMENESRHIKLNDYYCQNCQQKKGCNFTFCEKDHVINYCKNCNQDLKNCQLKDCNAKILYKKQIIYKFDE